MHYSASLEKCQKPLAAGWNIWKGAALALLFILSTGETRHFTIYLWELRCNMFLSSVPLSLELLVEIQSILFTLHVSIFYFGVLSSPHLHMVCCDCYICVYLYIYILIHKHMQIYVVLQTAVYFTYTVLFLYVHYLHLGSSMPAVVPLV